jgi:hypothetical protein
MFQEPVFERRWETDGKSLRDDFPEDVIKVFCTDEFLSSFTIAIDIAGNTS